MAIGAGPVGHDHHVGGGGPTPGSEVPVQPPLLVVALEEDEVGASGHLAHEVDLMIAEASVYGVRLHDHGPSVEGAEEFEESPVGVAAALCVYVFV